MYKVCNIVDSPLIHTRKYNGNGDDDDKKHEVFVVNESWTSKDVAKYIVDHFNDSIGTFTILNIKHLIDQVDKWYKWMPRVVPYYAVKCNNSEIVLEVLASLGLHFDCASIREIEQVLSLGVEPERIIFAHTTKPDSSIKFAKTKNIDLLTFDSDIELMKISRYHPSARLLIRIRNDAETAVNVLGNKFGCCPFAEAPVLLNIAKELKLNVVGVCFHVGSLCNETAAYVRGIRVAKDLFGVGSVLGHDMKILDIGGGFLGDSDTNMETTAAEINKVLDECFPPSGNTEIIAEPGRFFVSSVFTLACLVHSAKRPISMVTGQDGNVSHNHTASNDTNGDVSQENGNNSTATNGNNSNSPTNFQEDTKASPTESNGNCDGQEGDIAIGCNEIYESIDEFSKQAHDYKRSSIMYFMDNGIYGSFGGVLWKRLNIKPEPLELLTDPKIECSLWGPTCDGKDMICSRVFLPPLPIPSWLIFPHFGAYTCTTSTNFNGYAKPLLFTFVPRDLKDYLKELFQIKSRNKIKWTEVLTHKLSHQNIDENNIPSHIPFQHLLSYRTKHEDNGSNCINLMGIQNKPNQPSVQPTYADLFFTKPLPIPSPYQGIAGDSSRAQRDAMFPESPIKLPSPGSLLMPGRDDENYTILNGSSSSSSSTICPSHPISSQIVRAMVEAYFARNEFSPTTFEYQGWGSLDTPESSTSQEDDPPDLQNVSDLESDGFEM